MKPLRVLHVVGAMNRGGVETWLMHILRHVDRRAIQMDFLVHTDRPAAYDGEIRALGSRILACSHPERPFRYGKNFLSITKEFGPFDILHSHVHHFSGYVAWLGYKAGIPVRISHSHNDTATVDAVDAKASKIRHSYLSMTRLLLARYSTCSLAASTLAASALFGPSWRQNRRVKLLYCGIDLAPFSSGIDAIAARSEFGFDVGNIVFGHVGRFDTQKNHAFVAEIAAEIAKREPTARFLLVGDGPLRSSIEHQFCRAGISGRTVFTGSRPDIPLLMKGVMDRLLFPSLYEGLGLVLIEAQAANLPAIVSDAVPTEAIIVPTLIRTLSLQESAATWANCALQHGQRLGSSPLSQIQRSPFNITQCLNSLIWLYYTERTYCNGAPSGR